MAVFDRTIKPRVSSPPILPGALVSRSDSGILQTRSTQRIGWTWEEEFLFKWDQNGRAHYERMISAYRNGTQYDVAHQDFTLLGAGGGTPLVQGSAQTGATITTDGWPTSTNVLKVGDLLKFNAIDAVYMVTANATSTVSGTCVIEIVPPIFSGGSPADNAAVTITNSVVFKAKITELDLPAYGPGKYLTARIRWTEDP